MENERIIKFLRVLAEWCDIYLPVPNSPLGFSDVMRDAIAKLEKGNGKRELKYIISDFGEMFFDESRRLPEFDQFFTSRGSMSVSEFLMVYKGQMERIMKRGKIRNEDEAIAVNGLLSGMDTDLSEEDRRALTEILQQYERSIT